jgi:transcription initiation factor TFIIB
MKTQKNHETNKKNIKMIWELFDTEKASNDTIECIYSSENDDNKCSKCGDSLFISDEGFNCCSNQYCGKIYKETLDYGPEWRFYGADDINGKDPTRCGLPVNPYLKESSFACEIACGRNSSYEMKKIKQYTKWNAMPYKEKSTYDDFQIISTLARNSGIPQVIIDDALRYYHKISNIKTYRGGNRDGLLAASIYISCSVNNNPRTSKEIAEIFKLDNTSATRGCKNALSILGDIENEEIDKTVLHNSTPSSFINRYCSKLSINQELTTLCLFIANIVEKMKMIPENTPHSISAGIVYFVCQKCNLNISKKTINSISKTSEVTINKCFKKLETFEEKLIPPIILKKYVQSS